MACVTSKVLHPDGERQAKGQQPVNHTARFTAVQSKHNTILQAWLCIRLSQVSPEVVETTGARPNRGSGSCLLWRCSVGVGFGLELDLGPQYLQELGDPVWVRWPGWSSDQVAIHMSLVHRDVHVLAPGTCHVRSYSGIGTALYPFNHTGCCQYLRTVANGSDWLVLVAKVLHRHSPIGRKLPEQIVDLAPLPTRWLYRVLSDP